MVKINQRQARHTTACQSFCSPRANAADAHYHHLLGDVIEGGKLECQDGCFTLPSGPGLSVTLDRDKVAQYAEHYREVGGYSYDRDLERPGWYAIMPESRFADPRAGNL